MDCSNVTQGLINRAMHLTENSGFLTFAKIRNSVTGISGTKLEKNRGFEVQKFSRNLPEIFPKLKWAKKLKKWSKMAQKWPKTQKVNYLAS